MEAMTTMTTTKGEGEGKGGNLKGGLCEVGQKLDMAIDRTAYSTLLAASCGYESSDELSAPANHYLGL